MKKPEKGMNVPDDLLYTENHEWIHMIDDITGVCGITDYSQHNLLQAPLSHNYLY